MRTATIVLGVLLLLVILAQGTLLMLSLTTFGFMVDAARPVDVRALVRRFQETLLLNAGFSIVASLVSLGITVWLFSQTGKSKS